MNDIYFCREYGLINELVEVGVTKIFQLVCEYGRICNMFIMREIPTLVDGIQYFDIVSPYGYGGPVIECCQENRKQELLQEYNIQFQEFCRENKIVSEFVRFHPIMGNGNDFQEIYHSQMIRNTVGTNLKDYDDPVMAEFSKSCRKRIRRALRDGVTYKITEKPETLENFMKIYYATMDRNEAGEYYYFSDMYFERCLKYFRNNSILVEAVYEGKVIAAGFYFVWDKIIHIHLSGTLSEYLHLSPAYILRYAVTLWGKENGYELIHHGGGRSNAEDDSLYTFKKQFGENTTFDFYIGKKIWDNDVYEELCRINHISMETQYFPAYRSEK